MSRSDLNDKLHVPMRRALRFFLLWTVLGLFMFSQGMTQRFFSHDPTPWQHYLASWMVGVYIWFLLTPAVLWMGRRFPLGRGRRLHFAFTVRLIDKPDLFAFMRIALGGRLK